MAPPGLIGGTQWGFYDPHMQVLRARFLKLAGADVISDSQPVHIEEPGNHTLRNLLRKILPDGARS
jgi:hypothetical protein